MPARILMAGSIMMDLILQMPRLPHAGESILGTTYSNAGGGKGSNSAVAAARIGGDVTVCCTLGTDANGEALRQSLVEAGIDTSCVVMEPGANTGMCVILLDDTGTNHLAIYTGSNQLTSPEKIDNAFEGRQYDALMMQLEIPTESNVHAFELAKERGMITCLDCGPAQEYPLERFHGLTILSPNETETFALTGIMPKDEDSFRAACAALQQRCSCRYVVLKLGGMGCYVCGEGISTLVPAFKVDCLDPTAAGDCFTGVLVKEYAESGDILSAARYANAAAAISVQSLGAQPSLPLRSAVDAFLAAQH